jgi:hypothetical protein
MAPVNPQLQPINPPEWTNISRPISDIPADKSKALTIAAATDTLDTGVHVAESIDQDTIKEKTRAGVESIRDATTLAYENVRSSLIKGQQPDPKAAEIAGLSLMKANPAVPDALQAGLDRAEDLGTARAQGTLRANDTLYTGALNGLAKQLRAEYPGHKDFIDEQIARISGKNPANAYMDNLLQDAARLATGTDSFEKKMMSKAFENMGDPTVFLAMKKVQAGLPGAKENLANAVQGAEMSKLKHTQIMQDGQESELAGKVDVNLARSKGQEVAQDIVYRNFNSIIQTAGLNQQTVDQLISESRTGKITTMTPDQWESLAQHTEQMKDTSLAQIKSTFNSTGLSRRLASGGNVEDEQKIIANEMQFFDRSIAAMRDPNKGLFFEMQRRAKGIQDNANYQTMSGPMGSWLAKSAILTEKAGPLVTNFVAQQSLQKGYLGTMQNWFGDSTTKAALPEDPRTGNVGKSLTADIVAAKKSTVENGNKFDPRLYGDLVDNVSLIHKAAENGSPETAKEVAKYMFDPIRNKDFVNQWSRDFTDTNGVQHKGYFAYYDHLSSPGITDDIHRLKDVGTWDMYKNWQFTNFRQLFGNEVQRLGNIPPGTTVLWNSDRQELSVQNPLLDRKYAPGTPVSATGPDYAAVASLKESVDKMNPALRNVAYMLKKEGTEPSEGIFTMLSQMGYTPKEGLAGELPRKVLEAISRSQFQPSPEERLRGSFERVNK